jgi:hypothetical protein
LLTILGPNLRFEFLVDQPAPEGGLWAVVGWQGSMKADRPAAAQA